MGEQTERLLTFCPVCLMNGVERPGDPDDFAGRCMMHRPPDSFRQKLYLDPVVYDAYLKFCRTSPNLITKVPEDL